MKYSRNAVLNPDFSSTPASRKADRVFGRSDATWSGRAGFSAAACATLLLASFPSYAQERGALEEVLVTAERREVSLQDTAISISAFTGDQLINEGIVSTEQLSAFTPGLNIQRDITGKVSIRGIGTENFSIAGDPGVAISQDGAYIARPTVSIFDMYDVERVEILRGPQGTLYGRNATGGAINLISRRPTEEFEANVLVDIGNYSKRRVEAAISGTLVKDTLLGRVAFMNYDRGGYSKNIFPDVGRGLDELDTKDLWAARAMLTWLPTDSVSVDFKVETYRDDSNPPPFKYIADPLIYFGGVPFPNPLADQLRTVSQGFEQNIPGFSETVPEVGRWDQDVLQATVNWNISDRLTMRSITAYRETDFGWLNDGDGIEAYLVNFFQSDSSEQFTQEIQLIKGGEGRLSWIAGAYFLNEKSEDFSGVPMPLGADMPLAVLFGGTAETNAYALFGELNFDLTDTLKLTAGARFSKEDKDVLYVDDRTSIGGARTVVSGSDSWDAFTPKIALDWSVRENVMLYASITQGFKSGGFNLLAVQPSYDEEEVLSFEVGAKSRFADGRVQLNASAFYYDYTDLQVGKVINFAAVVENAADATIYGGELELKALLTDNLRIDWGVSLLHTEYDKFTTQDQDLLGAPVVDLAGNELPRSPGVTSSLSATYTIPLTAGDLDLWANWQHTGDQFFLPYNRPWFQQESYDLLNARVTYNTGAWAFSVYGENLTDKDYFTNALDSGVPTPGVDRAVPQFFVGAPRTYGVRVRYNFGQ